MHSDLHNHLTICPSASKPSIISSFWSIHVQVQPLEKMSVDLKYKSQASLPIAFEENPVPLRATQSLSDLHIGEIINDVSPSMRPFVEAVPDQENTTSRVNQWLNDLLPPILNSK